MRTRKIPCKAFFIAVLAAAALGAQAREVEVSQKGKTFMVQKSPTRTLRVNVGDTVSFRNDDPFFHNVYSASKVKEFDLGSYPQGQSKKVVLDQEGGIDVECAIHPDMKLHIDVVK
jgi:plastocyanin